MNEPPIPPRLPDVPPIIGPIGGGGRYPPRPPRPPRNRKPYRAFIWFIFGMVLILRLGIFHPRPQGPPFFNGNWGQNRRPPMRVQPAKRPVPTNLWRLQIDLTPDAMDTLRSYAWHGRGGNEDRPAVKAVVREGGVVYKDVAMHLKGSAGSFRPFDDKPSITLNFSKFNKGQKFHGYSKISFNNGAQDPSYLCEAISRELFLAAGVPTPQAGHATVLINERDLGLYVWTEGYGKQFLKKHFKNTDGNLYDCGFVQELNPYLEVTSGKNPDDKSDLRKLISAANEKDPDRRWERLNQVLDMNRFISLLAMEVLTCHWDGYAMNRNNTRLFHDLATDRMVFMPHGMDQMFGTFRSSPTSSIYPEMSGLLARAVMNDPRGRKLYQERMVALRKDVFQEDKIIERTQELAETVRPTLEAYDSQLALEYDSRVARLKERIRQRGQSVNEQLTGPIEVTFDTSGSFTITNWVRDARTRGGARLSKEMSDEKAVLKIKTGPDATASWRARLQLPAGHYRFEARAMLADNSRAAKVGLRISGEQREGKLLQPGEWTNLECPIVVDEGRDAVVLVAELRGGPAEAIFDQSSLKLRKE